MRESADSHGMTVQTAGRWMGVGASTATQAARAGREAVETALAGREAALVIVFASPAHDPETIALVCSAAAGGAPMVGCTTAGEIAGHDSLSGSVVAIAMGGEGLAASVTWGELADGPSEAGRAAAAGLACLAGEHRVLMLLSDGLAGHHAAIVRGAYSVGGAGVRLIGGSAGDDLAMSGTWQFVNGRARQGLVVGAAIASEGPIGIGVGHGWERFGEPMVVTESDGQWVYRLDDQPALDHYLSRLGLPADFDASSEDWAGVTLVRPLGLPRGDDCEIRAVLGIDLERRALHCSDVPQGSLAFLMAGDRESVLRGTERACADAVAELGGVAPAGMVAFDCAARRAVLGDEGLPAEIDIITASAKDAPVAGFYTYGEVARRAGSRGVHSATLVMLALG